MGIAAGVPYLCCTMFTSTVTPSATIHFKQQILQSQPYKGGNTRQEGPPVLYKLSSNENLLGPSPMAIEAVKQHLSSMHEYSHENDIRLREALAAHFAGNVAVGQFITANSGMELLDIVIRGFVSPGTEVILSSPAFMAYANVARLGGAKVVDVPLNPYDFGLNIDDILGAITPNTRLVFITNPNNPTGSMVSSTEMNKLITRLPAHVVVVYDEVYHDYVEADDFPGALHYVSQGRPVIALRSFSKAYGLAAMRIGYAYSTHQIADYLQRIRRPFMINLLSTEAAVAALADHAHLAATREMNSRGKAELYRGFTMLGIRYWPTEANFILIDPPVAASDFVQALLHEGVMVRDAAVMHAPGKVRITIGTADANRYLLEVLGHQPWLVN